ncbi:hypothetical protein fh0823_24300 [Francisella halioticida]|nr:hypothetical protein fh0823_24300 [Francisella halioticida]
MFQPYQGKPNYLGIKPTRLGSDTNMTVVTNEHTYYFHLVSTNQDDALYAVKFKYPNQDFQATNHNKQYFKEQHKADLSGFVNPIKYNMNYTFSGDTNLMPVQIWDNGKVTYMQFSPNQPQPSIFAVEGKAGKEAVVNYRRLKNNLVLVERVAPQFTLRLGADHAASVFNQSYIKQIKNHDSIYHNKNFFESTFDYLNPFSSSDKKPRTIVKKVK